MRLSVRFRHRITLIVLILILGTVLVAIWPPSSSSSFLYLNHQTAPDDVAPAIAVPRSMHRWMMKWTATEAPSKHTLGVLVPFRHRFKQLIRFVPHLSRFLNAQQIRHRILILHQTDALRFNRAALINVGHGLSEQLGCDYLAMHDVDLLPLNPKLHYSYPDQEALHLSPSGLHPKYSYARFVGGVLLMTHSLYAQINGMSNRYWGWGQEDDEFYLRLVENHVPVLITFCFALSILFLFLNDRYVTFSI